MDPAFNTPLTKLRIPSLYGALLLIRGAVRPAQDFGSSSTR